MGLDTGKNSECVRIGFKLDLMQIS